MGSTVILPVPSFDFPGSGGLSFPVVANFGVIILFWASEVIHHMYNSLSILNSLYFIYVERFLLSWLDPDLCKQ